MLLYTYNAAGNLCTLCIHDKCQVLPCTYSAAGNTNTIMYHTCNHPVIAESLHHVVWAAGQQALESEVGLVMSSLVNLVQFTGSAEVRVVSMQCLAATLKMSYHLLHPYKKQVVAALAAAIDDNKRQVRLEAVKCRKAWVSG